MRAPLQKENHINALRACVLLSTFGINFPRRTIIDLLFLLAVLNLKNSSGWRWLMVFFSLSIWLTLTSMNAHKNLWITSSLFLFCFILLFIHSTGTTKHSSFYSLPLFLCSLAMNCSSLVVGRLFSAPIRFIFFRLFVLNTFYCRWLITAT